MQEKDLPQRVGAAKNGQSKSGMNLLDIKSLKDKLQRWTEV